jgi:ADP-ribose pyrophosphatase YjhB (NUDIX family)
VEKVTERGIAEYTYGKGETLEECAMREIREETSLSVTLYNPRRPLVQSDPKRDPRKFWGFVIDNVYIGRGRGTLKAADDAKNVKVVSVDELEQIANSGMPFDHTDSARWYIQRRRALERMLIEFAQRDTLVQIPQYTFASEREMAVYRERLGITKEMTVGGRT